MYIKKLTSSSYKKISNMVGRKIRMTSYAQHLKLNVPESYCICFEAFDEYKKNPEKFRVEIKKEIEEMLRGEKKYAVRSSASIEDSPDFSFAGQFDTYLNLQGVDEIVNGICNVFNSVENIRIKEYLKAQKISSVPKMSVLIQEMVDSKYSGVLFSKNPINGLNQTIIEAVEGFGEKLVGKGITPYRWIYGWGKFFKKPSDCMLDKMVIEKLIDWSEKAKKHLGKAIDIEWSYDGGDLYILQIRNITTLKNVNIYSNKISKGFMPGMYKPLVWSINVPMINGAWKKLFTELIGKNDLDIMHLAKSFYFRSYFNMGIIGDIFELLGMPRETLELLLGIYPDSNANFFKPSLKTFKYFPRMFVFVLSKLNFKNQADKFINDYKAFCNGYDLERIKKLSTEELFEEAEELREINKRGAYYNIIIPLMTNLYNKNLIKYIEKRGYDKGIIEHLSDIDELSDIEPNRMIEIIREKIDPLDENEKKKIEENGFDKYPNSELSNLYKKFIKNFGHLSDSGNDFSQPHWRESEQMVVNMIFSHKSLSNKKLPEIPDDKKLKRKIKKVKRLRIMKENMSFYYTKGYSFFREVFLNLGSRLAEIGIIEEREDIFYIDYHSLSTERNKNRKNEVKEIKNDYIKYEHIQLPQVIYGDNIPEPIIVSKGEKELNGIAASSGYYKGEVKVVRGNNDFKSVNDGDVLVIPFSDISWSPIFVKAGAIISESGGILSHSAIIAREYKIPAVVSVENAMSIFKNNEKIFVDGYTGVVKYI